MLKRSPRRALVAAAATAVALGAAPLALSGATAATDGSAPAASATRTAAKGYLPLRLQVLALNDFHGQLEVVPSSSSSGKIFTGPGSSDFVPAGGAAYLAEHLSQLRQKAAEQGSHTVTVAAGDLVGATPLLSAAFHDEPAIEAMNRIGLEVAAVGNHEFDEGYRELQRLQRGTCLDDGDGADNQNSCPDPDHPFEGAQFRYLAANVQKRSTGATIFPAYKIKQYDGIKVGFIGMTLEDTPNIVTKAGIEGLRFTDEVETVRRLMPVLRDQGVKTIVVLLHEGASPTPTYEYNGCPGITGAGLAIAQQLPAQVDAVVSGHTHQAYNCTVLDPKGQPRLFTSASSIGRMVSEINLEIDRRTGNVLRDTSTATNHIVTNSDGTAPAQSVIDLINRYKVYVDPIANEVLGQIAPVDQQNLVSRTAESNGGDSPAGNLIADAQLADPSTVGPVGGTPVVALMNPGGIRADLAENAEGNLTYGAAFATQPFNNYLVSMTLTGEQLRAALNEQWNGRNEGAANNKILQVSGLRYTWDRAVANDAGNPTADAIVGDVLIDANGDGDASEVLDPAASYRVVVNGFLAGGGDGFTTLGIGADKFFGGLDIDALSSYLEAHNPYTPAPLDRISSIN